MGNYRSLVDCPRRCPSILPGPSVKPIRAGAIVGAKEPILAPWTRLQGTRAGRVSWLVRAASERQPPAEADDGFAGRSCQRLKATAQLDKESRILFAVRVRVRERLGHFKVSGQVRTTQRQSQAG